MKRLSESEVLTRIKNDFPHITDIRGYSNTSTKCEFFDSRPNAGWFKAVPRDIYSLQSCKGHPNYGTRKFRTEDEALKDISNLYPYITGIKGYVNTKKSCEFFDSREGKGWFLCRPNDLFTGRQTGYPDINKGVSDQESELYKWIKSLYPSAIKGYKLEAQQIDIFIPEISVGIEYNGLYWHSTKHRSSRYHLDKTNKAKSHGIKLIHVWEYEWIHSNKQLKSFLRSALKKNEIKIMARKCEVKEITRKEAFDFCNNYHIQKSPNPSSAKKFVGCFYKEELIGVAIFGSHHRQNGPKIPLLIRLVFKENVSVSGGFSKIIKFTIDNFGFNQIGTYIDLCKSFGESYLKCGWIIEKTGKPNYFYADHRTKKYISKQSMKKGKDNKTEKEKVNELGYYKVYDCGKSFLTFTQN